MKYVKKPIVIEAVQWTGKNCAEMAAFMNYNNPICHRGIYEDHPIKIKTLEGEMTASIGDYIIKGVKGEFYPCRKDIFEETYDLVNYTGIM